ncbi:MAG: molybdopterin-dependent oxidoreductase [Candidatus Thorarchaeota archaeon]
MPTIHIDGKKIAFDGKGESILDVARAAGIYIPTLCDHDELESYGGCRLCIVQVEGMRGFPPACTTAAKDGMDVKTSTDDLMNLKRNILQLLLMEHPSACIICEETERCTEYRPQPYKSGSITGCTTCPNRYFCDLRSVVENLGIKELDYEPQYKEVPVERNDPFFDRDYNLCILCARCIRVCDDVRGTSAITFVNRGHETRVDTAFGGSHIDSGCWFCGACIDVCPTGSLYPRLTKWTGAPDSVEETTCTLCGMGCRVEFDLKWERIMSSRPGNPKNPPNHHHMCVLGRFCIPSLVNAPDRIKMPYLLRDGEHIPISWDAATDEAARILSEANPERVGFIGSPNLSTESAYMMTKLARVAVKSSNIDFRGSDFPALIHKELAVAEDFGRIRTLDYLREADWIISVGGDFVKTHQVVAKRVYKEVREGKPLIVFGEVGQNLQRWATEYVALSPKELEKIISKLADREIKLPGIDSSQAERIVKIIQGGKGAVVIGLRIFESSEPSQVLRSLVKIAGEDGALVPLYPLGNEAGAIKAGLRPELLPGPTSVTAKDASLQVQKVWNGGNLADGLDISEMRQRAKKGEIDVLYIADGSVPIEGFERVATIIYQSPYPSDWMDEATVILPSATFVEESGTFINIELRELNLTSLAKAPGTAREDWKIFTEVGSKISDKGFAFVEASDIWSELSRFTRTIEVGGQAKRTSWKPTSKEENEWNPKYRGANLAERIEDLASFMEKLPERDTVPSEMSLDELVKHVEKERKRQSKEAV